MPGIFIAISIFPFCSVKRLSFFVFYKEKERKRNTKGTLYEPRHHRMEKGGGADRNAQQAQIGKTAKNKYWRNVEMYFDKIAKIVAERTGCDVASIKPESKFVDLGIDSLDTVELLMSLEDEIGKEIELDQKVETVDDLDKFIQSKTS